MEHATRLVERVAVQLGDRGYVDPDTTLSRRLFVRDARDPEWLIPVPLVEHHFADQDVVVQVNLDVPLPVRPQPPPPTQAPAPDLAPRTPNMREGWLFLREGRRHLMLAFDARGMLANLALSVGDGFVAQRQAATRLFSLDPTARPPDVPPTAILLRSDLSPSGNALDAIRLRPPVDHPISLVA